MDIGDVKHFLDRPPAEILEELGYGELLRSSGTVNAELLAVLAEIIEDMRRSFHAIRDVYSSLSSRVTVSRVEKGELGQPPPASYQKLYGRSTYQSKQVYYTEDEYPYMFALRRAAARIPDEMRNAVDQRLRELGIRR